MTDNPDLLVSFHGDLELLTRDLGCVTGTLKEIATVWRRAHQRRPDLPLGLPLWLETETRQLAAIVDDLAWAEPGQQFQLAFLMLEQMSALERAAAAAQAMTCQAGIPPVGDAGLWGHLSAAMNRARARRPLSLVLDLPEISEWPVSEQGH